MFFDTHAHYDDEAFDEDRDAVLNSMGESGVELILNPSIDLASCEKALELSEKFPFVYFAAGWHPEELNSFNEQDFSRLKELAKHEKCLAIGEIGLDYYWDDSRKQEQKELFARQLELALSLDKPVIVHDRDAHSDSLEIVSGYEGLQGVFHCYSGSVEMARQLLKMGWYLGFDGPLTYKNARKAPDVLAICPKDRILLETDSPYLSPVPFRGKRNDSGKLCYVAEKAAQILSVSPQELTELCLQNGKRLFRIK